MLDLLLLCGLPHDVGKTAHFHHSRHVAMPILHQLQEDCNLKPVNPQETGNSCRWYAPCVRVQFKN